MKVGGHDIRYVREADRNTIRCSFKRYDEQSGALRTFLLVNYFRHHARFFLAIFSSFAVRHVLLLNRESLPIKPSSDNARTLVRSSSMFSVNEAEYRIPGGGFLRSAANFAFRSSIGKPRRSVPFSRSRSNA